MRNVLQVSKLFAPTKRNEMFLPLKSFTFYKCFKHNSLLNRIAIFPNGAYDLTLLAHATSFCCSLMPIDPALASLANIKDRPIRISIDVDIPCFRRNSLHSYSPSLRC